MEILTEEQLRKIADSEELEEKEIKYFIYPNKSEKPDYIGVVLFDYDQGLSITDKNDTSICLIGIHGPNYKKEKTTYTTVDKYHTALTKTIKIIRSGIYKIDSTTKLLTIFFGFNNPTCSFK